MLSWTLITLESVTLGTHWSALVLPFSPGVSHFPKEPWFLGGEQHSKCQIWALGVGLGGQS